jgi:hypothetical protein
MLFYKIIALKYNAIFLAVQNQLKAYLLCMLSTDSCQI